MKRLLAVALLVTSGVAFAAEECPIPEQCGYTSMVTYQIMGADGTVVDETKWQNFTGASWKAAYAAKYAMLAHIFEWREGEVAPQIQQCSGH